MQKRRRLRNTSIALLGWTVMIAVGCGSIEPAGPLDEDGEPIPLPGPYDTWLQIRGISPPGGLLPLRPTLELAFTDYLDPLTYTTYGVIALQSGGIVVPGTVEYSMTDRTMRWTARQDLEPGFEYRLVLVEQDIFSMTGAPFLPPQRLPRFVADAEGTLEPAPTPLAVTWSEIEPIFEAKCNTCHSDPQWALPRMSREVLIDTRSEQVDAMLVRPFDPTRSYLMHKVLPDYPRRRFTVQPPPWYDEGSPLTTEELRRIEAWIRQGAR